jgi:hypothetical protein
MKYPTVIFVACLALAVAKAEDPFQKAPQGKLESLSVSEILKVREGPELHPDIILESQRIREIERLCQVALREGTVFQKRNAIEIVRVYNFRSLATDLMDLIDFKAGMIYTSGNPVDPAESAENIYVCYAILKGWVGSDLTKNLVEKLEKLGEEEDPQKEEKRKLLKMLIQFSPPVEGVPRQNDR